ncbi:unnamed protein product, partial [Laminaria digitata]
AVCLVVGSIAISSGSSGQGVQDPAESILTLSTSPGKRPRAFNGRRFPPRRWGVAHMTTAPRNRASTSRAARRQRTAGNMRGAAW